MHFGNSSNSIQACFNAIQEFLAQTASLFFIPTKAFRDVLFSLWREDQYSGHSYF